jgi:hypothetical protein
MGKQELFNFDTMQHKLWRKLIYLKKKLQWQWLIHLQLQGSPP